MDFEPQRYSHWVSLTYNLHLYDLHKVLSSLPSFIGAFGQVHKGRLACNTSTETDVAIKSLKSI